MTTVLVILGIVLVLVLLGGVIYNSLVTRRNHVQAAWAQIDVQLRRRHDLVPNLVETVKGYAAHERQTLEAVTSARTAAVSAASGGAEAQARAESALSQALFELRAVAEAYPDLKADAGFTQLQQELSDTENRIAIARQDYNAEVRAYDTKRQSVPSNLFAGGFPAYEYFEADPDSRTPVQVRFSDADDI